MLHGMKICSFLTAIAIFTICCTTISCSKSVYIQESQADSKHHSEVCPNAEEATLKDLTGLDGCSWVLVLANGKKLEPTNLEKFDNIKLTDGKRVFVEYKTILNAASICMVGTIVEIICISEK